MPNAHEYRAAALHLRRLAADLTHDCRAVRRGSETLAGGALAAMIRRALDAQYDEVTRAVSELDRLAQVCARRAEICDQYASELRRHRALSGGSAPWPRPPAPPAWWVEA